ncbi:TetR/AcrR family transcriptional regulator [Kribbella albertanoniae]|uniref:TetR/AcrR family transcriptional regulator n=1 Tax=Kribbella albertanoniae TaxID=1266829 RepID=A0A4R4QDA0_9ACTN|nr:TetR/AcrR family transcriptional regulator [Kribbella albertanoniae]TDC33427.1 TetR/AcrR family transcriptional regulator [Kribbella albertanoniae]
MTELLWGTAQPPSRGPKPAVTLAGIAEAAIRIADAEGLDAVSMQRVADDLPVTKMALYRYVPGKAELVAVMSDLAMGAPPERPELPWREALHAWSMDLYAGFTRHPWLLLSTVGRRLVGPNELTWMDRGVQALTDSGLNGSEQLDAVMVLAGHVRALALQTTSLPGGRQRLTEEAFLGAFAEILTTHGDRFPSLAAAMRSAGQDEQGLEFGLARILDGLEMLITSRKG